MMQKLLAKRQFSHAIFKYSSPANPHVVVSVLKDGQAVGDMRFELFENHCPDTVKNFLDFSAGATTTGYSYTNTAITRGHKGFGVIAGRTHGEEEEDLSSDGSRLHDENLELRHHSRGMLSVHQEAEHSGGSQFLLSFDRLSFLDGHSTVFGECVEGRELIDTLEHAVQRDGTLAGNFQIGEVKRV